MKEVINISRPSLLNTIWIYLHRNCTVANNCQTINQSWYVVFHSYHCEQVHIKANDIRANDTCNNTSVVMIDIKMVQYKININRWVFFLGGGVFCYCKPTFICVQKFFHERHVVANISWRIPVLECICHIIFLST